MIVPAASSLKCLIFENCKSILPAQLLALAIVLQFTKRNEQEAFTNITCQFLHYL